MLSTLGSIASQGGGFKGTIFDNGLNPFNLGFVGSGYVSGGRMIANAPIEQDNYFGINVAPLNINADYIRLGTITATAGTQSMVQIEYEGGIITPLFIPKDDTLAKYTVNSARKIISISAANTKSYGSGIIYFIEIL